ncbi:MAG: RNA-binding protein, partial [Bacillus sp. (in: firmicutes)]|nr:RNA-binding protein [Bacillus sp. (in: firmicutes)]
MEQTVDKQEQYLKQIATEQTLKLGQVRSVITLLNDGNTVPFMA